MDWRCTSRGGYDKGSAVMGVLWVGVATVELVEKSFGSKSSNPDVDCDSGRAWELACSFCWSVTVLDDDCDGDDGGRACDVCNSPCCWGGGEGEPTSSSGLAMRSPPRDCDRLRSPFIMVAGGQR